MIIRCAECNLFLGEIRDATLRKNIVYVCVKCRESPYVAQKQSSSGSSAVDQLKSMFGMGQ